MPPVVLGEILVYQLGFLLRVLRSLDPRVVFTAPAFSFLECQFQAATGEAESPASLNSSTAPSI